MSESAGFTDLRPRASRTQDMGFWPAFTDIMTVVVMVFLSALVIHVVRNVETVNNLRITLEAERAASEIARAAPSGSQITDSRAHEAEEALSRLRLQWLQLQKQQAETAANLAARDQELEKAQRELAGLRGEHDLSRRHVQALSVERDRLSGETDQQRKQIAALTADKTLSEQQLDALRRELDPLRLDITRLQADLRQAQELRDYTQREFQTLRAEHAKVQEKYGKLVKPERSALGRYVVEIRYFRKDGAPRIELREPNETAFRHIGRETLHVLLASLKQRHGNKLYTKVTIPDHSGLSYNEAWSFSNEILTKYDYYYQ